MIAIKNIPFISILIILDYNEVDTLAILVDGLIIHNMTLIMIFLEEAKELLAKFYL